MDDNFFLKSPVFFNETAIYLTDDTSHLRKINCLNVLDFNPDALEKWASSSHQEIYVFYPDRIKLYELFKKKFKIIEAAGGKVRNPHNDILFIYRLGRWDLPKGKIDSGETPEIAAIREVEEETGITGIEIISALKTTFHIYKYKSDFVLKVTHWFDMKSRYSGQLIPETKENIIKAVWLSDTEMDKVLINTYPNIKLLFCRCEGVVRK
ncbi:MAG: NUDIX hydrolase [Flavobacteriales bacterium]|nr:MAG: NUDIX hydrolase [Flavobacteriales bacterium]